jgi:Uma2 family endonuclease
MAIARQGLTLEEFLTLPEEKPALEFAEGMVTRKVSPKYEHSALQTGLVLLLDRLTGAGKLARVFAELRTIFGGRSGVQAVIQRRGTSIALGELASGLELAVDDVFRPLDQN